MNYVYATTHNKSHTFNAISATSQIFDIPDKIYEKLMKSISGPNSTIDGSDITYNTIAAVAAVPKFENNRLLYSVMKSLHRSPIRCPRILYNTGDRCPKCFAKHKLRCIIPSYYNTHTDITWDKRCIICHTVKEITDTHLCGSVYCMFTFVAITKPNIIYLTHHPQRIIESPI